MARLIQARPGKLSHNPSIVFACLILLACDARAAPNVGAARVAIAKEGQAAMAVVVASEASDRVRNAAQNLADYLGKISVARFEVTPGDGTSGIAVGLPGDFAKLEVEGWDRNDPTLREDYLLRSHGAGLYVLGASELAVEHAVWDLLHRLGYRQFFPGANWEIVPQEPALAIELDVREHPDYHARRIWYGNGVGRWAKQPYDDWCIRNRASSGIVINTGHAYDGILKRNRAEFDQHPEYLGLVDGQRTSSKFCISNPGLRQLVVNDALAQFQQNPDLQSVSVDPSDGGGWCECADCQALGSVSDRAVTLANEVAGAVEADFPGQYVGMYAYNYHSPPPSFEVHPQVVIHVATAFIKGAYTADQLLAGWQQQGATLGIREYYSVYTWDHDLPGQARGANLEYLSKTIPHFHSLGARFMSAESSDNWGSNGLGYYLASRMLWNVDEANYLEELRADFLHKAFGSAREPMAEFYRLMDAGSHSLLTDDLIGRMYRLLAEARGTTDDAGALARLADLVRYTHYVELWFDYTASEGPARQAVFEALVRHAYRIRKSMMVHTHGLAKDVPRRDKSISLPAEAGANVPDDKNIWLSDEPFSPEEIEAIVDCGMATRKLLDFKPVAFSTNLVPATGLKLSKVASGTFGNYSRGERTYHLWIEEAPAELSLKVTAGLVYDNRGPATLALFPTAEAQGQAVAMSSVEPSQGQQQIRLNTPLAGHHRLEVSDRTAGTQLELPDGLAVAVQSSPEAPATFQGRWSLYFYVPKSTTVVGGYASGEGRLLNSSGELAYTFRRQPEYFRVAVEPGQDGQLWQFQHSAGQRLLMTVPPYLARNERELLLPAEVVEQDQP